MLRNNKTQFLCLQMNIEWHFLILPLNRFYTYLYLCHNDYFICCFAIITNVMDYEIYFYRAEDVNV